MRQNPSLSAIRTVRDFDNGYWYSAELKRFAASVRIPAASRLRKDELESAIRSFLRSGKVPPRAAAKSGVPGIADSDAGLTLRRRIWNYRNDRATWDFIEGQAARLDPEYRKRSGARYRLNRWREEQMAKGAGLTYGDLVRQYAALSRTEGPFAQAPTGRYINFLSAFFAAENGATRSDGLRAWRELKELDAPKNYRSWARWKAGRR